SHSPPCWATSTRSPAPRWRRRTAMTDRYENIRLALAMEPMPGPWLHDGDGVTADDEDVAVAMCCPSEAEAAYIAACDPDTIRELLEERDALRDFVEAKMHHL